MLSVFKNTSRNRKNSRVCVCVSISLKLTEAFAFAYVVQKLLLYHSNEDSAQIHIELKARQALLDTL